jgi:hypothetical protein
MPWFFPRPAFCLESPPFEREEQFGLSHPGTSRNILSVGSVLPART